MKKLFIFASAAILACACGKNDDTVITSGDLTLSIDKNMHYKVESSAEGAKEYFADGQYNRASQLLQTMVTTMKGSEKGQEALYLFGLCNYYSGNYEMATSIFRKYYQTYPKGIYAEDAYFHSGLSLMKEAPEARLDQTPTYEAVTEFQNFIERYPYSERREIAMQHIFTLQDLLVEKEYLSAKLYYDLGSYTMNCAYGGSNYEACVVTAQNALRDFPYATAERREELSIMILRAKYNLAEESVDKKQVTRYRDCVDEYYAFVNDFPESKYLKEAEKIFTKSQDFVKKYAPKDEMVD